MMMNKKQVILIENLTRPEMITISGGISLKGFSWFTVAGYFADHWVDIKQAVKDFIKEH